MQLTEFEAAFKNLTDDLQLRPIHPQLIERVEAHILVAFLAYLGGLERAGGRVQRRLAHPKMDLPNRLQLGELDENKRDCLLDAAIGILFDPYRARS